MTDHAVLIERLAWTAQRLTTPATSGTIEVPVSLAASWAAMLRESSTALAALMEELDATKHDAQVWRESSVAEAHAMRIQMSYTDEWRIRAERAEAERDAMARALRAMLDEHAALGQHENGEVEYCQRPACASAVAALDAVTEKA